MSKRYPGGIIRKTPQTPSQTSAQGIWDMASVTQAVKENTWPIAGVPDPISRSLRFRSSASAYLNRTPASVGNRRTWTFSTWLKLGEIAASNGTIFAAGTASGETTRFYLRYTGSQFQTGYGSQNLDTTSAVYRDPSAWYHVVLAVDTTQSTAANRLKIYVNGVQQAVSTSVNYTQNVDTAVNNSVTHSIARDHIIPGGYFDGYLTETYLIDGQALTPSSFGNTNDQTGVWQPIAYTGTYGTNGFYLPFSNTASTTTLGYDFSGNSNNWTTNNISLTSGSTYDSMVDVPTQWIPYNTAGDTGALFRGNYAVLNPLSVLGGASTSNGNLTGTTNTTNGAVIYGTMQIPNSGKWYWELTPTSGGDQGFVGIANQVYSTSTAPSERVAYYGATGEKYVDATGSAYGATYTNNDIIGVAVDVDGGSVTFYKNNVSQGAIAYTLSNKVLYPSFQDGSGGASMVFNANFGQRPFSYTPPAGFKTLCTTNLSTPTIGATASTQANKYFDALLYTGNGSASQRTDISWANMQPDMVWIKNRSSANNHVLHDDVRGTNAALQPNLTNATDSPVGFGADGFGFGGVANQLRIFTSDGRYNTNGNAYVTWGWKGSGAAGVTNTAGSITSTVSANTTAGFSIVTYTGNNTLSTVGHGLGVSPAFIIVKDRSASNPWPTYHQSLGVQYYTLLNATDASYNNLANYWGSSAPTSTTFSINAYGGINTNGDNYVAYCFAQVAGYSAFGSYTGNGSSDGPFIFTGFRPAFVLTKCSSTTGNWMITDDARNPSNLAGEILMPNNADTEYSQDGIDMLSNGFKLRASTSNRNSNGATYIYMAFAESPFKYALAR